MKTIDLCNILERRFSLSEMHHLSFAVGVNPENIGTNHTIKRSFAIALVQYCERHTIINDLMQAAANANPALQFDGETLTEVTGASYQYTPPPEPQVVPVNTQKQDIINRLQNRDNAAVYEALIYLLENMI